MHPEHLCIGVRTPSPYRLVPSVQNLANGGVVERVAGDRLSQPLPYELRRRDVHNEVHSSVVSVDSDALLLLLRPVQAFQQTLDTFRVPHVVTEMFGTASVGQRACGANLSQFTVPTFPSTVLKHAPRLRVWRHAPGATALVALSPILPAKYFTRDGYQGDEHVINLTTE